MEMQLGNHIIRAVDNRRMPPYQRQKLSRAAKAVNRERGTESAIGVGSGELLNVVDSSS
jgi:hypothetical protein